MNKDPEMNKFIKFIQNMQLKLFRKTYNDQSYDNNNNRLNSFLGSFLMAGFYLGLYTFKYYDTINEEIKLLGLLVLISVESFFFLVGLTRVEWMKTLAVFVRQMTIHFVLVAYQSYFFLSTLKFIMLHSFIFVCLTILSRLVLKFDKKEYNHYKDKNICLALFLNYLLGIISIFLSIFYGNTPAIIAISSRLLWQTVILIQPLFENKYSDKLLVLSLFHSIIPISFVIVLTEAQKKYYLTNLIGI